MIQKIIRVGNSAAVTLPKSILEESGVKIGAKVNVSYKADMESFVIDVSPQRKIKRPVSREFQKWLEQFTDEDRGLLKELASR